MASSFTSLHSLPTELLAEILELADGATAQIEDQMFAGFAARRDLQLRPLYLAAVCRRWRERMLSVPQVWRRVYMSFAPRSMHAQLQYLNLFSERAGSVSLHVYVAQAPGSVSDKHLALIHVLQTMLPKAQGLALWMASGGSLRRDSVFAHLNAATPLLRRLSIRTFFGVIPPHCRTLPCTLFASAPLLSEFSLFNVPLAWFDAHQWKEILSVTLLHSTFDRKDLLAFGTWWPNLRSLVIEGVARPSDDADDDEDDDELNNLVMSPLPRLELLELTTSWCFLVFLRTHICLGSLKALRLSVNEGFFNSRRDPPWWRRDLAYFFAHGAPGLAHLAMYRLSVYGAFDNDLLAHAKNVRSLHFQETMMDRSFFDAVRERGLGLIEYLSFRECKFCKGAPAAFALLLEQAYLPLAASSSTPRLAGGALKRLHIAQVPKSRETLRARDADRIRAAIPFAEIEDIQDF